MMFKRLFFLILITCFTQATIAAGKSALPLEVVFETNMGSFNLELYPDKAPKHVENFLAYVDAGFYDNTIFHRVISDFVIQGGGFEKGMKHKKTREPVKNESSNRLKNLRGTISMARRTHPDTATSQFYINLKHNTSLDYKSDLQPGYTVFGRISKSMDVIDKIASIPTHKVDIFSDVPKQDVIVISVKRKIDKTAQTSKKKQKLIAGEHYIVLDKPVPTRNSKKIEVVEMFSYGCPHCYEFEPLIKEWAQQQDSDVDFWFLPAVWNKPMKLLAQAFYAANALSVAEKVHLPLFNAIVIEQKSIRNEDDLAEFFAKHGGVNKEVFSRTFNSMQVDSQASQAEELVRGYKPAGVPEVVVNGKYRVDRMRAGGYAEMLAIIDFLVDQERVSLKK